MAMNVKFLKGLKAALPTTRDNTTLYFVTDEGALYLGNTLIGADYTSALEAVNAAIKVINDHGYVNSTEVATAIGEALESYYTKEQVDAKIGTLKIGDVSYDSVVDYVVAKTTGIATDAVVAGKADKVKPTTPGNFATLGEDGNLVDSGTDLTTLEGKWNDDIVSVVDEKISIYDVDTMKPWVAGYIEGLELKLEGKEIQLCVENGTVVASLDATEFIADGMLQSVVADQTANTLTFTWNTDSGVQETVVELSSIADIYTGSTNADEVNVAVSNENVISATIGSNVKADIAKGVEAHGWGNHANAGYAKTADLGDLAGKNEADLNLVQYAKTADISEDIAKGVDAQTRVGVIEGKEATWDAKQDALTTPQLAAVNSGVTADKVNSYDTVTTTVNTNKTTWDKASTAIQPGDDATLLKLTVSQYVTANEYATGNTSYQNEKIAYSYNETSGRLVSNILKLPKKTDGYTEDAETLATQEWAIQQFADVSSLKSAAYVSVESLNETAKGYSEAVQGATTNTVKDCVDAINAMNNQTGEVIGTVENIVNQLTWGEF